MKKITFVSDRIPFPPDKDGNNENIFYITKTLSSLHHYSIKFIVFSNNVTNEQIEAFRPYVSDIEIRRPFLKYLYFLIPIYRKKEISIDPVFFCNFNSGYYFSLFKSKFKVLYSADSPSLFYSKIKGFKSKFFFIKFLIEETILFSKFNKIVFVSDVDINYTNSRTKGNSVQIPIGFDPSRVKANQTKKYDLIFSGNFNYKPNREAADIFINNHAQELIKNYPNIKICFVGRNPSLNMIVQAKKFPNNIFVTGEVESVEEYLVKSKIYFSPLLSGSGMKNKILQAMAAKLPIVCTIESLSGFNGVNKGVFLADNLYDLISKLERILQKTDCKIMELGKVNYQYFISNYSWTVVVQNHYIPLLENED